MIMHETIVELRRQLQIINDVISALERLEPNRALKRDGPPNRVDSSRLSGRREAVSWPVNRGVTCPQ
jgi:hypothetical protein